jgi:quinol monooxygenase YgiN
MPIYQTATYQVKASAVAAVKAAIAEFVEYIRANEPETRLYAAWQQESDPTRFVHLFVFEDEAAQTKHSQSDAVGRFEAVYSPELVGGPVVFTDFVLVAENGAS